MTPKQYLMQAIVLKQMIDRTEAKIFEIRSKMQGLGSMRYDKVNVQSSPEDKMASYIDRIVEFEKNEHELLKYYTLAYHRIQTQIDGMERPIYRQILAYRYLDGLSITEIAEKMSYDRKYISDLHGYALREFGDQYGIHKDEQ